VLRGEPFSMMDVNRSRDKGKLTPTSAFPTKPSLCHTFRSLTTRNKVGRQRINIKVVDSRSVAPKRYVPPRVD